MKIAFAIAVITTIIALTIWLTITTIKDIKEAINRKKQKKEE